MRPSPLRPSRLRLLTAAALLLAAVGSLAPAAAAPPAAERRVVRGSDGYLFIAQDWSVPCQHAGEAAAYGVPDGRLWSPPSSAAAATPRSWVGPDKATLRTGNVPRTVPAKQCGLAEKAAVWRAAHDRLGPDLLDLRGPLADAGASVAGLLAPGHALDRHRRHRLRPAARGPARPRARPPAAPEPVEVRRAAGDLAQAWGIPGTETGREGVRWTTWTCRSSSTSAATPVSGWARAGSPPPPLTVDRAGRPRPDAVPRRQLRRHGRGPAGAAVRGVGLPVAGPFDVPAAVLRDRAAAADRVVVDAGRALHLGRAGRTTPTWSAPCRRCRPGRPGESLARGERAALLDLMASPARPHPPCSATGPRTTSPPTSSSASGSRCRCPATWSRRCTRRPPGWRPGPAAGLRGPARRAADRRAGVVPVGSPVDTVYDVTNLHEFFVHHEDVRRATGAGPRALPGPLEDALWTRLRVLAPVFPRVRGGSVTPRRRGRRPSRRVAGRARSSSAGARASCSCGPGAGRPRSRPRATLAARRRAHRPLRARAEGAPVGPPPVRRPPPHLPARPRRGAAARRARPGRQLLVRDEQGGLAAALLVDVVGVLTAAVLQLGLVGLAHGRARCPGRGWCSTRCAARRGGRRRARGGRHRLRPAHAGPVGRPARLRAGARPAARPAAVRPALAQLSDVVATAVTAPYFALLVGLRGRQRTACPASRRAA